MRIKANFWNNSSRFSLVLKEKWPFEYKKISPQQFVFLLAAIFLRFLTASQVELYHFVHLEHFLFSLFPD